MTKKELKRILGSLGRNPQEIANSLKEKGIAGNRCDTSSCPLAKYLCNFVDAVEVEGCRIVVWDEKGRDMEIFNTKAQTSFIEQFDNGTFPELELP